MVNAKDLMNETGGGLTTEPYRQLVGSLQYIASKTRPDIVYPVNFLSKFLIRAEEKHLTAAERVLRYLKTTIDYGLVHEATDVNIEAYSDADFGNDPEKRQSTSGILVLLGGGPVVFSSRKQSNISQSTAEAGYVAACETCKELVWVTNLLAELKIMYKQPTLWVDNQSAMRQIKSSETLRRSKHVELKYHYVREKYKSELFKVQHVSTTWWWSRYLLQDCPTPSRATIPEPDHFQVTRHSVSLNNHTRILIMIINTNKCLISKVTSLGTYQAAGQLAKIYLTENGYETNKVFFLVNLYIRPKATYQETNKLFKKITRLGECKFSRILIAGDFKATSASWDPENLRNADMANKYRAIYETKILRGRIIDYSASRHGLSTLFQDTNKPRLTFVNPGNPNQTAPTYAWIDAALAGSKARRIWHAVQVSDEKDLETKRHHKTITILNTEN